MNPLIKEKKPHKKNYIFYRKNKVLWIKVCGELIPLNNHKFLLQTPNNKKIITKFKDIYNEIYHLYCFKTVEIRGYFDISDNNLIVVSIWLQGH